MNIIGRKYIFLIGSAALLLVAIAALLFWGLKLGIDFTGGSLLEVVFPQGRPSQETLVKSLEGIEMGSANVQESGDTGYILRFKEVDEKTHQAILARFTALSASSSDSSGAAGASGRKDINASPRVVEQRFDAVGPTIGNELRRRSFLALGLAGTAIVLYIAWAFRQVSQPVSSWKYGVAAVVALLHDVLIPAGVFALLGHWRGIEVDTLFITALLTVMGFSVHDTIVVFDRIRENLRKAKGGTPFATIVNHSVNETITRSINTSLTVLLVLVMIFFFGGTTVRYFSLALIVGVVFGTYSSIFVASPLLVVWHEWGTRRAARSRAARPI